MGNRTTEQWAGRERLSFIERNAWWLGAVNRGDLKKVFGISTAQASADIQGYLELNPGALAYNLSTKRYESQPEMRCALQTPQLEDAVRTYLGGSAPPAVGSNVERGAKADVCAPPLRNAPESVERRVFMAVRNNLRISVKYWSVSGNRVTQREIAPHALAHDGLRWHVRAWCFVNSDFRDFVLGRIESAEWPGSVYKPEASDQDWHRFVTIRLRPHSALSDEQRLAIERDYRMTGGFLVMEVRAAMKSYCLAMLRVPVSGFQHLEIAE